METQKKINDNKKNRSNQWLDVMILFGYTKVTELDDGTCLLEKHVGENNE